MDTTIIRFLASFLIWIMFLGLFVLWIVDGKIKKEQVIHGLVAASLAWIIAQVIKATFPVVRPFMINGFEPLTFMPPVDSSFPSGHSSAAFALAFTIWLHDKKVGNFYLLLALLVGVARVFGNVHYPLDIFAGAALGILVSWVLGKSHWI